MLWYSLELPHRGNSGEYHNIYFYGEIENLILNCRKNGPLRISVYDFMEKKENINSVWVR